MEFLIASDALKGVDRRTSLIDRSRRENSAEHSWQVMLLAMTLIEHAEEKIDLLKVLRMLAIHDLGEIQSGDVFHFHKSKESEQKEREAAKNFFAVLPEDQAREFFGLWEEFEAQATPEARFAAGLDRVWPSVQNFFNEGGTWKEFGISIENAKEKNRHIARASEDLWQYVVELMERAQRAGYFPTECK